MNFRNLSLGLLTLLLAAFSWQNWAVIRGPIDPETGALATPSRFLWLDLAVSPGMVLLAASALLAVLYLLYTTQVRTSGLVESRRWAREVEAARKLADEAEASRFEQLRGDLETRFEALDTGLRHEMDRSHNVLVAHIAEFEDHMRGEVSDDAASAAKPGAETSPSASSAS